MQTIDTGDTAWLLVSTALVLLMTPGLALFYGGMVRSKGVLNMIMMSFVSIALVTVVWLVVGYTLAFGDDIGGGLIGGLEHVGMAGIDPTTVHGTRAGVPVRHLPAHLRDHHRRADQRRDRRPRQVLRVDGVRAGLGAGRLRPRRALGVGSGRLDRSQLGALDFAGGLVVEIVSGASGLALALVLGPRIGFRSEPMRPHNLPMVAARRRACCGSAGSASTPAPRSARERHRGRRLPQHPRRRLHGPARLALGRAAPRRPPHHLRRGLRRGRGPGRDHPVLRLGDGPRRRSSSALVAGVVCSFAVGWKFRFGYDDSLDVVGVHLVGGVVGTAADRPVRRRGDDRRRGGAAVRRRARPARQAGGGGRSWSALRLRGDVRHSAS